MIPPNFLQYIFYAIFPLSGTAAICFVVGLKRGEMEPTYSEEEVDDRTPFQRGEENPGIRQDLRQNHVEANSTENIELETSEIPEAPFDPLKWGEEFRKENLEPKPPEPPQEPEKEKEPPAPPQPTREKPKRKKTFTWADLEPAKEGDTGAFQIKIVDGLAIPIEKEGKKLAETVESKMWVKFKDKTFEETEGELNFGI